MEEKVKLSDKSKEFEVFFPKDCDLDKINRVTFLGREFVEIVRCKDCKYFINGYCYSDNFVLRFEEVKSNWFCADGEVKNDKDDSDDAVKPEHGVWISMIADTEEDGFSDKIVCSECLVEAPYYTKSLKGKQKRTAYCPNCGAKMDT